MTTFNKVREKFAPHQHSQKSFGSRSEDWIEAHWIIERLNDVYHDQWTWQCIRTQTHTSERRGKVYYEVEGTWMLTLPTERGPVSREGEGADGSDDLCNAKKGASSYAMRHAAKHWGIGLECWISPIKGTPSASTSPSAPPASTSATDMYLDAFAKLDEAFVSQCGKALKTEAKKQLSRYRTGTYLQGENEQQLEDALTHVAEAHNPRDKLTEVKSKMLSTWERELTPSQYTGVLTYMKKLGKLLPGLITV